MVQIDAASDRCIEDRGAGFDGHVDVQVVEADRGGTVGRRRSDGLFLVCPIPVVGDRIGDGSPRILLLASELAEELSLSEHESEILDIASQLYDIGMVSVPLDLAAKWRKSRESLSPSERDIIHQHPFVSANLAQFQAPYHGVSEIIRCHHERLDGSGFPLGVKGSEIPRLARILGAAVRIHESAHSEHQALEELLRSPESTDPEILQTLRKVIEGRTLEMA